MIFFLSAIALSGCGAWCSAPNCGPGRQAADDVRLIAGLMQAPAKPMPDLETLFDAPLPIELPSGAVLSSDQRSEGLYLLDIANTPPVTVQYWLSGGPSNRKPRLEFDYYWLGTLSWCLWSLPEQRWLCIDR
ncbi:MAG: hypothetical protein AAF577_05375 [Pseudomonadota bacterium]